MKKLTLFFSLLLCCFMSNAQANNKIAGTTLPGGLIWYQLNPNANEAAPHATIYFFRKNMSKLLAPLKKMPITLNDSLIGELKLNTMLSIVVNPGKYTISADKKDKSAVFLNAKAGTEYFYNGFIDDDMFTTVYLTAIKPGIARKETGLPVTTPVTNEPVITKTAVTKPVDSTHADSSLMSYQKEAMFPGGAPAWIAYLQQSINPKIGRKYIHLERNQASVQQTVMVSFLVDKNGKVTNVTATSAADINPKLEDEAIRVISNSPDWIPAIQNGKKVIYRQKQNIVFENSWK